MAKRCSKCGPDSPLLQAYFFCDEDEIEVGTLCATHIEYCLENHSEGCSTTCFDKNPEEDND